MTTLISVSTETNLEKYKQLWDTLKELESEKDKANEIFKKGDYDSAISLYTKLLDLDPNNKSFMATILCNRALCYQKKNKLFNALSDINKSISINSNYWKAYYRRATINIALKMASKSKDDLQKVLELDPSKMKIFKLFSKIIKMLLSFLTKSSEKKKNRSGGTSTISLT